MELAERDFQKFLRPSGKSRLILRSAFGSTLIDDKGARYHDLTAAWNVMNVGWSHPAVIRAVRDQLDILSACPSWCSNQTRVLAVESLLRHFPNDRSAIPCCSGSEAIEAAIKCARLLTGRTVVVGFSEAYHGSSTGALLVGGLPSAHRALPPSPWHRYAPLPMYSTVLTEDRWVATVRDLLSQPPLPAAFVFESLSTNSGITSASSAALCEVVDCAKNNGVLVIVDEVGTGVGRTGKMFAFEHFGIEPDIVVVGKAVSAGIAPCSAAIVPTAWRSLVKGLAFDSTYAWCPLSAAAVKSTMDVVESDALAASASAKGSLALSYLRRRLSACKLKHEIRGLGLSIGIELHTASGLPWPKILVASLLQDILEQGVFLERSRHTSTLLIMPPLNIEDASLIAALEIVTHHVLTYSESDAYSRHLHT